MKRAVPYALAGVVVIAGVLSLGQYNVTWDEALGDLFFGQRYFSFFTTFDAKYLDFKANPYPRDYRPDLSGSAFRNRPWEHYPVASTLATATSRLLGRVFDPFDGYHAFNLILAAIFVVVFFRFVEAEWGALAASVAIALLFLSPRIAGDVMANVKDFSEMVFFSLAAITFYWAFERVSLPGAIGSGVLFGLALGTKANALFLPLIVVLYVILSRTDREGSRRPRSFAALRMTCAWVVTGAIVFFLSWPYLWHDPIRTLTSNMIYLLARKSGTRPENMAGPFQMIVFTTPLAFMLAFAAGAIALVRKRSPWTLFVACWIAVVVGRLALPSAINFDGVRHFLELFPPLAACGAASVTLLPRFRPALAIAIALALFVPLAYVHPFEAAYWNVLTGGLKGAMARGIPQAGDYWAASYRIGMRWIDQHAPPDTILVVPIAEHTVYIVKPYRLRRDIALAHVTNPWSPRVDPRALVAMHEAAAERPVYVMFILRRDWANDITSEALRSYQPIAGWGVDGAPVLLIYRMTLNR